LSVNTLVRTVTIVLLAAGCNGKDTSGDGDTDSTTDETSPFTPDDESECVEDSDCSSWQICEDEECASGDRNNTFEEAEAILWETGTAGYLQSNDDVDYYTFGAEGEEWIRVTTEPTGSEDMNTVLSLYDPNGKLHHTEDDFPTGPVSTYDTVLYAYLPVGGDWILAVEDRDGASGSDFAYELVVQETSAYISETDSFDDPASSVTAESSATIWTVGVLLEEAGDVDYITLNLPYDDCPVLLYGAAYDGGTDATATVELYTPGQERLLRKEGLGPEGLGLHYGVDGGQAVIAATDAFGGGGDSHWFFVYILIDDEDTYAQETEPNDFDVEASPLPAFEAYSGSGGDYLTTNIWGDMESSGDEDWYRLEVDAEADGRWLHLLGSSLRFGSLMTPAVEVYDDRGSPVDAEVVIDDGDSFPDQVNIGPVSEGEVYYIRITDEFGGSGLDYNYRITPYLADFEY